MVEAGVEEGFEAEGVEIVGVKNVVKMLTFRPWKAFCGWVIWAFQYFAGDLIFGGLCVW